MTGVMIILRAGVQYFLVKGTSASVVVTTSYAVAQQCIGGAAYAASKCGASGFIGVAAFAYSAQGIRFNQICLGAVMTNIAESMFSYLNFDQEGYQPCASRGYNAHKKEWVIKEMGVPEDSVPVAVFLGSDEYSFVNTQKIMVNGGQNSG